MFFNENGIQHTFFSPQTPQQNKVAERKNTSLRELVRMMLNETHFLNYFLADAVSNDFYVMNH